MVVNAAMGLSNILRKRRKELGLTLAEIADKMGVSEATVQRWESGNIKNMRQERISKLAELLHVTPAYLMGWEDEAAQEAKKEADQKDGLDEKQKDEIRHMFDRMSPDQQEAFLLDAYRIVYGRTPEDNLVKHSQEDDFS